MKITATVENGRLVFDAPSLMKDRLRQIPGVRWHRQTDTWRGPLSWSTALAARAVLGEDLVLAPTAVEWGLGERERVLVSTELQRLPWADQEFAFQDNGIAWLNFIERGVLGDEPGLGKTRQACMATVAPALVITTNSTKLNWKKEYGKWRPSLSVTVLSGSSLRKAKDLTTPSDVYVVNWESIRTLSRLEGYGSVALTDKEKTPGPLNRPWATVIADEVHAAKDPHSKQTRAYWAIMHSEGSGGTRRRYGLSGTLSPEGPENVWAPMHGLAPEEYPSRTQFIERYTESRIAFWGGLEILGLSKEHEDEFRMFFEPRFLRRTKAQALPQLPEKLYSARYLDMDPKQRKAYDELEVKFLTDTDGGALVVTGSLTQHVRLLQAASATPVLDEAGNVGLLAPSNKVNALLDLISESPNEPLAVASPSRKLLDLAAESLVKAKISFSYIHGDQPEKVRDQAITDFMVGAVTIILVSTKAGGTGINLQRAQRLVFLSRPEASVESIQTEDRVHRIGQDGQVEIIDFVSADTIEHDLHENLQHKLDLAQQVYQDPQQLRRLILSRKESKTL